MNYICEKCGAVFVNADECSEHEKTCTQPPIKAIIARYEPRHGMRFSIDVITYPDVIYNKRGSTVELIPGGDSDSIKFESDLHLDKVQETNNNGYVIYTTNFDAGYERACIAKLVERMVHDLTEEIIGTITLRDDISQYIHKEYPENEIIRTENQIIY